MHALRCGDAFSLAAAAAAAQELAPQLANTTACTNVLRRVAHPRSERVASALRELAGVKAVSVDLAAELATVEVAAVSLMDALDMLPG